MDSIKQINMVMCGCMMGGLEFFGVGVDRKLWYRAAHGREVESSHTIHRAKYVKRSRRLYFWNEDGDRDSWSGVTRDEIH